MGLSTTAEQHAFHGVKRVCYAGLDSVTLRVEIARRVERVVPSEENHFWTLDPETGLITHGIAQNPSPQLLDEFLGHHYPDDEATQVIDQARAGAIIRTGGGEDCGLEQMLRGVGIRHHVRALFFTPEAYWGSWCILRGDSPRFTDREARFLERIAPHVAEGLKSAALLELSQQEVEVTPEAPPALAAAPAFLVLGPHADVLLRTSAAGRYLDDLGASGVPGGEDPLPFAVLSVRGRLLRRRSLPDDAPADARLRARGRSGTWYTLHATLSEPDASGRSSTVISIEPAARREIAPVLFRLYGLSPRERQVLLWVLRGEPTKRIAWHLGLSAHTVQDYLDKACEKIGVRGRKALVAKLFQDGFAPELCA